MPLIRPLLVASWLLWLGLAGAAVAQEQPAPLFPPPAAEAAGVSGEANAAQPSLWHRAGAVIVRAERDFSRELNKRLASIRRGEGTAALIAGVLAAFLYGVFHTLAVGHGKTVVIGYFLGHAARPVHGVGMAAWIAVSHVLGAVVVAVGAQWVLSRLTLSPIEQNHWIRLVSFAAIALIGAWMLIAELRRQASGAMGASHDHDHEHDHWHSHGLWHGDAGRRRLLAVAAGFVPCSGAILILTFAIANGILASGLLMVGGIALGMALTLAGLGLVSMLAHRQIIARMGRGGTALRWLSLLGPALILLIGGLLLVAEASVLALTARS